MAGFLYILPASFFKAPFVLFTAPFPFARVASIPRPTDRKKNNKGYIDSFIATRNHNFLEKIIFVHEFIFEGNSRKKILLIF